MIWLLVLVVHIAIEQIENKPNQHRMLRLDYNYDEMYDIVFVNIYQITIRIIVELCCGSKCI
jgi:hypothetical protein